MCTLLHTPKTLEIGKKSMPCLVQKLQGVWQIACLKRQFFLSFPFYKTQISYEKIMCVCFLFHWFSGENWMFLFSWHKGPQTSKELKRNMNDGTILFLTSLLIVLKETRNSSKFRPLDLEKKWKLNFEKCFVNYQWAHVWLSLLCYFTNLFLLRNVVWFSGVIGK